MHRCSSFLPQASIMQKRWHETRYIHPSSLEDFYTQEKEQSIYIPAYRTYPAVDLIRFIQILERQFITLDVLPRCMKMTTEVSDDVRQDSKSGLDTARDTYTWCLSERGARTVSSIAETELISQHRDHQFRNRVKMPSSSTWAITMADEHKNTMLTK